MSKPFCLVPIIIQLTYDHVDETLYVIARAEKLVIETDLTGNIIGTPLDISMAIQPEGIYFVPESGEMWLVGEPNEIFRFTTAPAKDALPPSNQPGSAPGSGAGCVSFRFGTIAAAISSVILFGLLF